MPIKQAYGSKAAQSLKVNETIGRHQRLMSGLLPFPAVTTIERICLFALLKMKSLIAQAACIWQIVRLCILSRRYRQFIIQEPQKKLSIW